MEFLQVTGLESFVCSEILADCNISAQDQQFKAHKVILSATSRYFYDQFVEQKLESVQLPEPIVAKYFSNIKPFDVFPTILKFMYSNQSRELIAQTLNAATIFPLYSLAHSLQMPKLLDIVSNCLQKEILNDQNAAEILYEALEFDNANLQIAAKRLTLQNFETIVYRQKDALLSLPLDIIKELAESDDLNISSETVLYNFIVSYLSRREELPEIEEGSDQIVEDKLKLKRLSQIEKLQLLQTIRYPFLSHNELLNAAQDQLLISAKDLILEGLSVQLSKLQHSQQTYDYRVNHKERNSYKKQADFESPLPSERNTYYQTAKSWIDINYDNRHTILSTTSLHNTLPKPPQQFPTNSRFELSPQPIEFIYQYDFDENGALYFLGTHGKTRQYSNPHVLGQVQAFASSIGFGQIEDFVGRKVTGLRTQNEVNSYFGVDIGTGRLFAPTAYTLRNRKSNTNVCLNWQFEASKDKQSWKVLDRRIHESGDPDFDKQIQYEREALQIPGATTTWGISEDLIYQMRGSDMFRYFRIVQIGKNSSQQYNLGLSGIELYGRILAGNWP